MPIQFDKRYHIMKKLKLIFKRYPLILKFIRFTLYLIYRYIIYFRFGRFKLQKNVSFVNIPLNKNKCSFFGYYNISPWNIKGDILFYETSGKGKRASINAKLEVKIYKPYENRVELLAETKAWNWQQGCMLQWLANSDDEIIYNNYNKKENKYYSEILNVKSKKTKHLKLPIYAVSPNGTLALTLNFSRLRICRPDYGYFNKNGDILFDDKNDGIWLVDIQSNDYKLIISLEDLKNFEPDKTMIDSRHWVNHIDISPDGNRFMFLHRWKKNEIKYHRLLTADVDGSNLYKLAGNRLVSHCIWKNNEEILAWTYFEGSGNNYYLITDKTKKNRIVGNEYFSNDGHPSFSPDRKWLLTDDANPDRSKFRSLILYNENKDIFIKVGNFFQPSKYYKEMRCDLHPKWNRDGNFISIDSAHNGTRSIYILNIKKIFDNY